MTEEQHDYLSQFIKEYRSLGLVMVFIVSFAFGVGVKITDMQGQIDANSRAIATDDKWRDSTSLILGEISVQIAENNQALQDIKSQLGITQQRGGN